VLVLGDRDELLRLLENLITNAVKYGEGGGKVEISLASMKTTEGHPQAVLSVRDFGPGIAPEHLPRLTERFYRVDVEQSRQKGGTGLGLAIVKHIVNRHRGSLDIDSEPGAGARFVVTLPETARKAP
jgi:two-component system phosphate regulon sensor histidine kinase PhoR